MVTEKAEKRNEPFSEKATFELLLKADSMSRENVSKPNFQASFSFLVYLGGFVYSD